MLKTVLRSTARKRIQYGVVHWDGCSNSVSKCSFNVLNSSQRHFSHYSNPWLQSLYESRPVVMAEQALTQFHELSGLSWWSSIVISTIGFRVLATFPLAVYSEFILAKLANLEPKANEINNVLKEDTLLAKHKFQLSESQATKLYKANLKKQIRLLIERENCHPMKARLLVFLQIPLWVGLSCSLRDMALKASLGDFEYLDMRTEGLLWFSNLSAPDVTLILPIATALLNLTNVELYHLKSTLPKSTFVKIVHNVSRTLCFIVIPAGLIIPSGVSLYWLCSAFAATCQHLIIMSPRFRRLARIPVTNKELPRPYSNLWCNFQKKISRKTS